MAKAPRLLAGRVVVVTGGARGIGRATAAALIAQGARVAIGDLDASLAAQAACELGGGTLGLVLDVTERSSFAAFLDEVERRLGPLDVLVNNAGIMPVGPFVEETDATAQRLVDVNLHGVIIGSKLAIERFQRRGGGHLVNIASVAGKGGFPGGATYCATKHAVVGLSEAIRAELRGTAIDVSIVMPVVVNTELGSGLHRTRGIPLVQPDDVARAIVDALQTGRVDVYVPRPVALLFRAIPVVPRWFSDFVVRALKGDQVLVNPDHMARDAYQRRLADRPGAADAQTVPCAADGPKGDAEATATPEATAASEATAAPEATAASEATATPESANQPA